MRLLVDNLLETTARQPDACALKRGGIEITYQDLVARASSVAQWVRAVGVARGDSVALLADAGEHYVAAYYGVLMAGAVVVPLNTAARAEELRGWIHHSGATALIVDGAHPEASAVVEGLHMRLPVLARKSAHLSGCDDGDALPRADAGQAPVRVVPDSPASFIYTSGTTGRPKAVVLSHRNLACNTVSILEYLPLSPADRILCVLPFHYSFGNSILHTHIAAGAGIVLGPSMVYPHLVAEALVKEAVTGFAGVPATFALLVKRVQLARFDLGALRYVMQAGGPLPASVAQRLLESIPNARLFVMYGQTEAAARLTYVPPERLREKLGSVGVPVAGVEIDVRRDDGSSAPRGEIGEIWARGANVMSGYWKDVEATRNAIVGGWLRTGDLGQRDEDGYLFIHGRRSDIIKVGAHRVFPGDVEGVAQTLQGVQEAAAVGVEDDTLGEVIKLYVVCEPGAAIDERMVKSHCRLHLAQYKIPKFVEFLSSLPKTSSGKVQRHLLTR